LALKSAMVATISIVWALESSK